MALLKIARANQGAFRADNYEDLVAYAALAGESAHQENQANESARMASTLPDRVSRSSTSELPLR